MNPFSAKFSPELPRLLHETGGSIILTTYQTGKVIVISSDGERITQLVRDFDRPMGVAFHNDLMALALRTNITFFKNDSKLARTYPPKPDVYDTLFYPTGSNITSYIDTHDIAFSRQGLIAVNTAYSCLAKVDGTNSFEPVWFPPFINEFAPGDACHLNGLCVDENLDIRYVSAFGKTSEPGGWRLNKLTGGFLYDIREARYLCEHLPMPHSPRIHNGELYLLLSATEELVKVDRITGATERICKIDGFIRGLSFYGHYAFVGTSKLRKSHTFGDLPIARKKLYAGVVIIDLERKSRVAEIYYDEALEEIYDVHFIPNSKKANIMNHQMIHKHPAIVTPERSQWITPKEETDQEIKPEKKEINHAS